MKKTIALLSIVMCIVAGNATAQTTTSAPRTAATITLENVMISSVHAHMVLCTNPIGTFSATRTVCTCGTPYTIPFVLSNGITIFLPAPQWIREAGTGR